jgi:hypothetical protein
MRSIGRLGRRGAGGRGLCKGGPINPLVVNLTPTVPRPVLRNVFLACCWLFFASLVAQVYLAGRFIFGAVDNIDGHAAFGYTVVHGLALVVLVMSFFLRAGWMMPILAGAQFLLAFLMPILATAANADAAALHPVAAVLLVGLSIFIAEQARALAPGPLGHGTTAPAPTV